MTLEEIACRYDCDKAVGKKDGTGHGYTVQYEKFFEPMRYSPIKILEIGVASGPSIQMWLDYFTNAHVYGLDIVSNTNEWNTPGKETNERYTFMQGNQSDPTMWQCYFVTSGKDFDIIIDDGSHKNCDIIPAFSSLWPALKSGGLYCVEDLAVGINAGTYFVTDGFPRHSDWLASLSDTMHQGKGDIESVHLSRELAIILKRT